MSQSSLQDLLGAAGNPVEMLRNPQTGPNVYPGRAARIHQLARRDAGLAEDLRALQPVVPHGRPGGRRARTPLKLLTHLGVNSFAGFAVDKAKQFVPCSYDGYVIGDVILFYLAENTFNLVGRAPALNWITLPRRDRRLRRQGRARPTLGAAHGRSTASRTASRSRARTR